jgi:hypothetical protein
MLRFISHLFKLNYEECKGCDVLKNQLAIANNEKEELRKVLLDLVKPKVYEAPSVPIESVKPKLVTWDAKRRMLEEQSRVEAQIRQQNIEKLERELEIEGKEKEG